MRKTREQGTVASLIVTTMKLSVKITDRDPIAAAAPDPGLAGETAQAALSSITIALIFNNIMVGLQTKVSTIFAVTGL